MATRKISPETRVRLLILTEAAIDSLNKLHNEFYYNDGIKYLRFPAKFAATHLEKLQEDIKNA